MQRCWPRATLDFARVCVISVFLLQDIPRRFDTRLFEVRAVFKSTLLSGNVPRIPGISHLLSLRRPIRGPCGVLVRLGRTTPDASVLRSPQLTPDHLLIPWYENAEVKALLYLRSNTHLNQLAHGTEILKSCTRRTNVVITCYCFLSFCCCCCYCCLLLSCTFSYCCCSCCYCRCCCCCSGGRFRCHHTFETACCCCLLSTHVSSWDELLP